MIEHMFIKSNMNFKTILVMRQKKSTHITMLYTLIRYFSSLSLLFSFLILLGWNAFVATIEMRTRKKRSSMVRIRNYKVGNLPTDSVPSYFSILGCTGYIRPHRADFPILSLVQDNDIERRRDDKGASREFIDFGLQSPLSLVSFIRLPFWLLLVVYLTSRFFTEKYS